MNRYVQLAAAVIIIAAILMGINSLVGFVKTIDQKPIAGKDKQETIDQGIGDDEQFFDKIRKANYDYFLDSRGQFVMSKWQKFPIVGYYQARTRLDELVRWICETFRNNPIVNVELGEIFTNEKNLFTIPYKLTLRDGRTLEGNLPFEYQVDRGVHRWHGIEGIDWHLKD